MDFSMTKANEVSNIANVANVSSSTAVTGGPKTQAGKAISSKNATKDAIFVKVVNLIFFKSNNFLLDLLKLCIQIQNLQ